MANLKKRVCALEKRRAFTVFNPKELTNEELIYHIREALEKDFAAGRFLDVEVKIKNYEAKGKTLFDLSKEEPEWFHSCVRRMIDETKE